jgi:hypothetical protein
MTSFLPASGGNSNTVIDAEGCAAPKSGVMNLATQVEVEGDYLQAIGVPLLSGRYFTPAEAKIPWLAVVGEVADVKEASPDEPGKQQYYTPVEQYEKSIGSFGSPTDVTGNGGSILVRTAMEPEHMANVLRATVRSIDPQLPLAQVQSMERVVSNSEAPRRFNTLVISAFAIAAALLAALGM